ncbi:hypothetical protein EF294_10315 [Gordonia oryzae]|uniref:EF-hand domain-containing protein n=1 Tax=Gordonia oryzae TaxID=2487349 RepID=A0A3N4GQZ2_9ACTN|nr:hypothetical protein [Gordonia oryzae]RPA61040.1 hypothetical protein EF294_10315 [Gordonia oryzae]
MSKVWVVEFGELGLVVAGDDVIVVDVEPFEEGFVEFSPTCVGGLPVLLLCIPQDEQAAVEDSDEAVATHGGLCEDALGGCALDGEAVLFAFEVFDTDGVGVVRFEELLGLIGDEGELADSFGTCGVAFGEHGVDVLDDVGADAGELLVGASNGGPVGDDRFLDLVRLHGTEGAAVLSVLTAEAVKVVVLLTDPAKVT